MQPESTYSFCSRCGAQSSGAGLFCSKCGRRFAEEESLHRSTATSVSNDGSPASPLPPSRPDVPNSASTTTFFKLSEPIWNPAAAVWWSLLFTPALGAFIHASNWASWGDHNRARNGYIWGTLFVVEWIVFAGFEREFGHRPVAPSLIYVVLFIAWFSIAAREQLRMVKILGGNYQRKSWWAVLIPCAVGLFLLRKVFFK